MTVMRNLHLVLVLGAVLIPGLALLEWEKPSDSEVFTPDYVISSSEALIGEEISVNAEVREGPQACSQAYCGPENPCCNSCSAPLYIGSGERIRLEGENIGCSGNNCALNCAPQAGKEYVLRGELGNDSGLFLEVESFEEGDQG